MQELPLFGDCNGALSIEPWSGNDDAWRRGLPADFEARCHPLAVAATFAFAHAVTDRLAPIPTAVGGAVERAVDELPFSPQEVQSVACVAKAACVVIRRRMANEATDDDDSIHDAAADDYVDFLELLALYLASSDAEIGTARNFLGGALSGDHNL